MKAVVVIFRQGRKGYAYRLGDSYHSNLCCTLAKHPQPGIFVSNVLRKYPVVELE